MKLRLLEIKQKYKDNEYLNSKHRKFLIHNSKNFKIDGVLFEKLFNNSNKCIRVARFINYMCNENKQEAHINFEQICYVCNCSYETVEYTVRKLSEANLISHTINIKKKKNNLKRLSKLKFQCNPFKWIFKFGKKIEGMLRLCFPKSKGWIAPIPNANINRKYVSTDDIEWFDELTDV